MDGFVLEQITNKLLNIDPVFFCQEYLTLDGKPFRLHGNGYKPFSDIYRYIGIKALEKDSLPVIMVKGRQVGATTMASALEMFFMGCGLFGAGHNPPIRIVHAFPQLDLAFAYTKVKLNNMITSSVVLDDQPIVKGQKPKAFMQTLLDSSSPTNDSLQFKQFLGGNHIWIESTGVDGQRLRGKTADILFCDECFPYDQYIETENGKCKIGKLYDFFIKNESLPLVKTFNEDKEIFEFKKISNAWSRGKKNIIKITCGNKEIKCTPNHKFLTDNGWIEAKNLTIGSLLKTSPGTKFFIRSLNDDQLQVVLGSFLGDGHLASHRQNVYRLKEQHGLDQKDYCEWKASIFGENCKIIKKNGFSRKNAIEFCTKTFALDIELPNKKTYCPQWVLDNLDVRGLAIWYMDDGSTNTWATGSSGILHTSSFDEDTHIRIVNKLKSFGIDSKYTKHDGNYILILNKGNFNRLNDLVRPFVHENFKYKFPSNNFKDKYQWNNNYKSNGFTVVSNIKYLAEQENVYDIEVEDNHNFILAPTRKSPNLGGPIAHNCQDMPAAALSNSTKILAKSQYGAVGSGIQVYFGTPKQRGSEFWEMWDRSSQQYYHLGCEKCKKFFPLYTPSSNEWENIWLYGFIVRCTHCGYEQNKLDAAERGKWIASRDPSECKFIGFHINQLYMPGFSKEKILGEKPGISAINTERAYQNEVLGEFYHGEASIMTPDQVREICGDPERKFRANISSNDNTLVFLGIDIGAKNDLEQLVDSERIKPQGQSYSTAVVIALTGPSRMSIEFATKFKRNDIASKKGIIDQIMRQYSCNLAVCDIGFAGDLNQMLQTEYGDKFLASQSSPKVNQRIKFDSEVFPKMITFEKDYWIADLYEQMKKGSVRFPLGDYEKIAWLIQHCTSMEIKPSISRTGEISPHYIKGTQPNDGFSALLNAYIAYKFYVSNGFQIKHPLSMMDNENKKPPVLSGFLPRLR